MTTTGWVIRNLSRKGSVLFIINTNFIFSLPSDVLKAPGAVIASEGILDKEGGKVLVGAGVHQLAHVDGTLNKEVLDNSVLKRDQFRFILECL